jgi:hypothetical protein
MASQAEITSVSASSEQTPDSSAALVKKRAGIISWSSLVFAVLQSACTAVIAISAIRVWIGLGALAAASGVHAAATGFHRDAIRIPMMALAFVGAGINLFVVWKIRHLRNKPSAQWRQKPLDRKKIYSERLQIALAIITMALLAAEWFTHSIIHRPG